MRSDCLESLAEIDSVRDFRPELVVAYSGVEAVWAGFCAGYSVNALQFLENVVEIEFLRAAMKEYGTIHPFLFYSQNRFLFPFHRSC